MIAGYTVINPTKISVQMEGPLSKHSRDLRLTFHGEEGQIGSLLMVDYDVERANRLFDAINQALAHESKEKAEAA